MAGLLTFAPLVRVTASSLERPDSFSGRMTPSGRVLPSRNYTPTTAPTTKPPLRWRRHRRYANDGFLEIVSDDRSLWRRGSDSRLLAV